MFGKHAEKSDDEVVEVIRRDGFSFALRKLSLMGLV
jgi:hypothetical protein